MKFIFAEIPTDLHFAGIPTDLYFAGIPTDLIPTEFIFYRNSYIPIFCKNS